MHKVAVLALDGVVPFDLATPCEVFGRARLADGRPAYEVRVCSHTPSPRSVHAGVCSLRPPWGVQALAEADTVIVPGLDPFDGVPTAAVLALRAAAARGARMASVCSGAFVLAATGLLDGLRATTHWAAAPALARRHPAIEVDPDVLYVDNGQLLTSAGAAASFDLCLHMIRLDHGAAVAADAARTSVMPLERAGGQAQYIHHHPPGPGGLSLEPLLVWMEEHLDEELTLASLARRAALSERTLCRRFREQTGTTPARWVEQARITSAQHLLEASDQPVERIAAHVGFGSPVTFRSRFRRQVGVSPAAYRRSFRARSADELVASGP